MHFPIIEILENDPAAERFHLNQDDPVINANVDYIGEEYSETERKDAIGLLKKRLEDIADVDVRNETITFFSPGQIEKALGDYCDDVIEEVSNMGSRANIKFWHLRELASRYRRDYSLFWMNGFGYTSMGFVENAPYYARQTFKIGKIYDAHY